MPSKPNTRHQRIGLLGGSFNPPHDGHREISLAALDRLNLDAIWWLVTPGNPLKDPDIYAPFEERLRQAIQLANHSKISVSDFEQVHKLHYTIYTLNRLILLHPEIQFVWIMGADSLANFHLWKDWDKITALVPIAVFNRPGFNENILNSPAAKALKANRIEAQEADKLTTSNLPAWIFFADTNNPTSSSDIRRSSSKQSEAPNT